jgi:hypothetical protein
MASAVTVIFGANSTQFQAELKRMQALTATAGRSMSSGRGIAEGHVTGTTGIIRESTVIAREIAMGRGIGRIAGSFTLLMQYIASSVNAHKDLGAAAEASTAMLNEEASAASVLATELKAKAAASALASAKTSQDAKAALSVVNHYEQESIAARQAATALNEKAEASKIAAAASLQSRKDSLYEKAVQQIYLGNGPSDLARLKGIEKEKIEAVLEGSGKKNEIYKKLADAAIVTGDAEVVALSATAEADVKAAEASAVNAEMMEFKFGVAQTTLAATVENAAATELVAVADLEAAAVQQTYAVTLTETAVAEHLAAMGAAEMETATLPILPILIAIAAVLFVLYGAYKLVHGVIHSFTEEKIRAAESARKAAVDFQEEAAALNKLAEAADKTEDAIRKMNMAHDEYAKKVDAAVEAQKNLYEHAKKLAGLKKDADLTKVDTAEKLGTITHNAAIKQKAEIEKKANADAAAAQTLQLENEVYFLAAANQSAAADEKQKQAAARTASDALTKSAEGIANVKELDRVQKLETQTRREADTAADEASKMAPGHEKDQQLVYARNLNAVADVAHDRVVEQRANMKPGELAAADALTAAQEATANAKSINEKLVKSTATWANQVKNSPSEVTAENANIDLKTKGELLPKGAEKGYSLNSQQQIGAYAATAPVLLQQLNVLRSIDHKVTPGQPASNHPPGERKPQLGTRPQSTVNTGSDGHVTRHTVYY